MSSLLTYKLEAVIGTEAVKPVVKVSWDTPPNINTLVVDKILS
jgi:hypothetical protein